MWAYNSIFYQIYPIGFCGAPVHNDGECVPRIRKLMDWSKYLEDLGVDSVLLNPVFESDNHGYDTRDFKTIDCRLGTNEDFAEVVASLAHFVLTDSHYKAFASDHSRRSSLRSLSFRSNLTFAHGNGNFILFVGNFNHVAFEAFFVSHFAEVFASDGVVDKHFDNSAFRRKFFDFFFCFNYRNGTKQSHAIDNNHNSIPFFKISLTPSTAVSTSF